MTDTHSESKSVYPLTFCRDTSPWISLKKGWREAIRQIGSEACDTFEESRKTVAQWFKKNKLSLPQPVVHDECAKAILDSVFEVEQEFIESHLDQIDRYRRTGRHIREYLADRLLKEHLDYLKSLLSQDIQGIERLTEQFDVKERFVGQKALDWFRKKVEIYIASGSFVHVQELTLSSAKVKTRSKARAERGNLWLVDRRKKYLYLESLADSKKIDPPLKEDELEFLVSQSSLDMLKKKADLLYSELGHIEPNRMKANYSRLRNHLQHDKQRRSDFQRRKELLVKLGASPEQVEYISARATYKTMKNLLKLGRGKLAISDLMGGKRTIRKLMQRYGRGQSQAERAISDYLVRFEKIDRGVAESYARTRKNHSLDHLQQTIAFLKENYRMLYRTHWGFQIRDNVLRRALELGVSRRKLSKRSMASKDFMNDLRRASSIEESLVVSQQQHLSPESRRLALAPFREVLEYESDTFIKKQLYFIYEQFCEVGFCIPKDELHKICLDNSGLFPARRSVQNALDILYSAYRAIGRHGERFYVLPDYLLLPDNSARA